MNTYYRIAADYFRQMEGWHLYRKQGQAILWVWSFLALAWVVPLLPLFRAIGRGDWVMYGVWLVVVLALELVWLGVGARIAKRKRIALIDEVNITYSASMKDEQACRVFMLTKLLERSPDQFFAVAKEISDLLKLRNEFRGKDETEPGFWWRFVIDRDAKPRLLALTLACITVFTALLIRSLPESQGIFDVIADRRQLISVGGWVMVSAAFFCMLIGARVIGGVLWHVLSIWAAKTFKSKTSATALSYLAKDLVLLHTPVDAAEAKAIEPAVVLNAHNQAVVMMDHGDDLDQGAEEEKGGRLLIAAQVVGVVVLGLLGFLSRYPFRVKRQG